MYCDRSQHTFHIPVMGIGYTLDTPVKVASLGISSAISLVDDMLMERMREFYSQNFNLPFEAISEKIEDFRAKRITAYLNMVDTIVKTKVDDIKQNIAKKSSELEHYIENFPNTSIVRKKVEQLKNSASIKDAISWLQANLPIGSIDVNIMTKLDKANFSKNEKMSIEHNDAHAALRGFAQSNLNSSLIFSAGMNPRLYSYVEQFDDFYPTETGELKKKITLKVSDYRSAAIQGRIFAKKGIWVSEYRVESGLNCGGHAFATNGFLLGPILEEFKNNRQSLIAELHGILVDTLTKRNRPCPENPLEVRFTAQGGVGTSEEHQLLIEKYNLDSIGWGTPFLLVPEATSVDNQTLSLLQDAKEDDLYLSGVSPLGVQFNNLRTSTKSIEREQRVANGTPGSNCIKKYAVLNTEFTENAICTASKEYQRKKIKELKEKDISPEEFAKEYASIVEKECICVGLGTSLLQENEMNTKFEGKGVSVCPGPNLAYFSKQVSLKEMIKHIYGNSNVIERTDRPNLFMKELSMYVDHFNKMAENSKTKIGEKQHAILIDFKTNLENGIDYYRELFGTLKTKFQGVKQSGISELAQLESRLKSIQF